MIDCLPTGLSYAPAFCSIPSIRPLETNPDLPLQRDGGGYHNKRRQRRRSKNKLSKPSPITPIPNLYPRIAPRNKFALMRSPGSKPRISVQGGFTLIEALVALLLSAVATGVITDTLTGIL